MKVKTKIICGIYKITSPTHKIYIGQSANIYARWRKYKSVNCKHQLRLFSSFRKHGINCHKFEIIHVCVPEELNRLEKYYVDLFNTFNSKNGLNSKDGGGHNTVFSQECKEAMSKYRTGKKQTEETKRKRSEALRGRKRQSFSDEHIQKLTRAKQNMSEETKMKMSKAKTGKTLSTETRAKMSLARLGQKRSEAQRKKMSDACKGRVISKTASENMRLARIGKTHSNETKNKMCKILLNTNTGIFYFGIKEAALSEDMSRFSLAAKLIGQKCNNTPFIYTS